MRQGLFPICIVCAVIAASSRKNFDKPSIATEKLFCNSKGFHSRSKQCLRIYKDHFALQNTCWEIPNPSNLHRPGAGCAMESLNSTKSCWSPDVKKTAKQIKSPLQIFYYAVIALALTCLQH